MGFLNAAATFILGPFGIGIIVLGVVGSFMAASVHMLPPRSGFISVACGALAFVGAYFVRQYINMGLS